MYVDPNILMEGPPGTGNILLRSNYLRLLKLARTNADLVESQEIRTAHMAEALQYQPRMGGGFRVRVVGNGFIDC